MNTKEDNIVFMTMDCKVKMYKIEEKMQKVTNKLIKDIERINKVNEINSEKEIESNTEVKEYAGEILKMIREEE